MRKILGLVLLLCMFVACRSDKNGTELNWKALEGQAFEYQIVGGVSANKIEYGDRILFHYQLYNKDSLIESSWRNGEVVELILPDKMHRNQFLEPLTLVGKGDSLIVRIPYEKAKEELSSFADYFQKGDWATFKYKVLEVETRKAQQEKKQSDFALAKGFESRKEMLAEQKMIQNSAAKRLEQLKKHIQAYKNKELKVEKGPQGLEYYRIRTGKGPQVMEGDSVYFYYQLALLENGKVIDNLFKRGERMLIEIGKEDKYIPAFQLALQQMREGDYSCFFVPADLAYGKEGSLPLIPSDAKLVLDMEIVAVKAKSSKAFD